MQLISDSSIKVSVLISVYNADQYIEGCIEDLVSQSLFQRGSLELLFIDCASPGNEAAAIRAAQAKHNNIVYIRWPERVTLYQAWNIGAQYARGEFLTNANCDDRHSPTGVEQHLSTILANPSCDLVYADVFESQIANQSFQNNPRTVRYGYKPFFGPDVVLAYQFGCQPMWRRSVHEKIGGFASNMRAAGDYDFNFRFNLAGLNAIHIAEPLGSFLARPDSLSSQDTTSAQETGALRNKYINPDNLIKLYGLAGWDVADTAAQINALHDMTLRAFQFDLPWHPGQKFMDAQVALVCLNRALELSAGNHVFANNLAVLLRCVGEVDQARALLSQLNGSAHPVVQRNLAALASNNLNFELCYQLNG